MKRVVVTGFGTVNVLGNSVEESWNNLLLGKCGIGNKIGYHPIDINEKISGKTSKVTDYAIVASYEALNNANLLNSPDILSKAHVIVGTGIGGLDEIEKNVIDLHKRIDTSNYNLFTYRDFPRRIVSPMFIVKALVNLTAGCISVQYGIKGQNYSPISACATGNHAIIDAIRVILLGEAKCVIAGGAEASICPIGISGFASIGALYGGNLPLDKASRPFDSDRNGFLMSEGAGILVLEDYDSAIDRGANILAEVIGYGTSSDADSLTSPTLEGMMSSISKASKNIDISSSNILFSAHATSTKIGDIIELEAIKNSFGNNKVYVTAHKSAIGHALGASAAISAIFCIKSLAEGIVPPTINLENSINEYENINIHNKAINTNLEYALCNSAGFGGTNATVAFKKY